MIRRIGLMMAVVLSLSLFGAAAAHATQTVDWTGNGLDSVGACDRTVVDQPYLHWVLTPGGTPVEGTSADLFLNGVNVGTMTPMGDQGALQLTITVSPKFKHSMLAASTAYAEITSGSVGDGAVLTISDGCLCVHRR